MSISECTLRHQRRLTHLGKRKFAVSEDAAEAGALADLARSLLDAARPEEPI